MSCPECLRTQPYAAPVFPCACGTPVVPPVVPGATGEPVTHRNWTDEWVTVRCVACGREDAWPHPELGCTCGTVLRVPVLDAGADGGTPPAPDDLRGISEPDPALGAWEAPEAQGTGTDHPGAAPGAGTGAHTGFGTTSPEAGTPTGPLAAGPDDAAPAPGIRPGDDSQDGLRNVAGGLGAGRRRAFAERYPTHIPLPPTAPHPAPPRPSFRPVTIRTARDAVAASAGYLRWLGFRNVVQPEERTASGVDLRAPGLVAQVDPSTRPAALRAVECLWLNGLSSSAVSVFFSLAGYTPDARSRADELGIPLFVLDLTGTPQPVNTPADELITTGA
ncbi:hypothetical protein [Streptomyces sp. NPDC046712]|uniref:hypothetical protein n=1 Tax=Streptomyces sp. NPDC046712 TaxID=3154802 RepID=UPI0033FD7BEE